MSQAPEGVWLFVLHTYPIIPKAEMG